LKILAVVLILVSGNSAASGIYLSRDICGIEFESLMKHSGQKRTSMRKDEINQFISDIRESSSPACLDQRRVRKLNKQASRVKPYKEKCWAISNRYYSDSSGKTIYYLSSLEIKRAEARLLNNDLLPDCLSPLLIEQQ
jgi:hypothetical protein